MGQKNSLSGKVAKSLIWKFCERGSVQITQFIVGLVIARILSPEDYGSVALLTIFITVATVFVQSGLSTALIQKKNTDEVDYSSVFYYSIVLATIVYALLFFLADLISKFYNMPELKIILRVMALTLFPGALNSLQIAILTKKLEFKKQFYSSLIAVILSGIIGIILAALGYGPWALVFQQLSYQVAICFVLWGLVKWRPKLVFSYSRTKMLLAYGIKLLAAKLIDTIYHNLESLIIGKKYSAETLAYCNKGKQFPLTLIDNIDGSVQSVMLSAYSKKQDNVDDVKKMLRRTLKMSTYIVFPAMLGLLAVGNPLIDFTLGEKWLPSVPYLQLYCVISMLFPLQTANLQAINAIGRSDTYLKLMIIKRILGVIVLGVSVVFFKSPYAIVIACLVTEIMAIIVNIIPNKKLLKYSLKEQIEDIIPNLFLSIFMIIPVYLISYFNCNNLIMLIVQCCLGIIIYLGLSIVSKNDSYIYIKTKFLKKRSKTNV